MLLFRSILIPLVAALMNVLSMAATLGVMSAVYVWGWGGSLFGASRPGPVEAPMVVMIFAILFGLSMDYQVFLASRIQEEWRRTGDNMTAVARGLAITGRTITAAAVIMIVVFGSFILGGERLIKEFGLGLAAAVFVDAFLIRVAVVPAVMILLGRSNWWLPRRVASVLPRLGIEAEPAPQPREQDQPVVSTLWQATSTFMTPPPSRAAKASAARSNGSIREMRTSAGIVPSATSSTARSKSGRW
jgi:RND superfamily putative drug exporter